MYHKLANYQISPPPNRGRFQHQQQSALIVIIIIVTIGMISKIIIIKYNHDGAHIDKSLVGEAVLWANLITSDNPEMTNVLQSFNLCHQIVIKLSSLSSLRQSYTV